MAIKTGGELSGLAVVSLGGGERMGRVDDVLFVPTTGRVTGFLVDRGGMFSKPKRLPAAQVRSLGADALTIDGEDALAETAGEAEPGEVSAKSLGGRPVLSEAGTVLGKVADVGIDTDALAVPHFVIATGLLDNALHGRPVLPLSFVQAIGADSIIVSNTYDPKSPQAHA